MREGVKAGPFSVYPAQNKDEIEKVKNRTRHFLCVYILIMYIYTAISIFIHNDL